MPPKRKCAEVENLKEENDTLTYASETPWLRFLTGQTQSYVTCEEVTEGETNSDLITEACKLTYLLYHDVNARDCLSSILQALNKNKNKFETSAEIRKAAKTAQSLWKGHIVNKFLLPHVKEIIRKWHVAHPYASFDKLQPDNRVKLWMEAYDTDQKGTVLKMWKPVIKVLNLSSIFCEDLAVEDQDKMKAIREMFRRKYYFGCECTYKHSIAGQQKNKTLDEWAAYATFNCHLSSIVVFADLPISPETLAIPSSKLAARRVKKVKDGVASEDFEDLVNPTQDLLGSATMASTTTLLTTESQGDFEGQFTMRRNLSVPCTSSISGLLSVPGKSRDSMKRSTVAQNRPDSFSPSVAASSEEKSKPPSLREFFGIMDQDTPLSPTHSEKASSYVAKESLMDIDWL